MKRWIVTGVAAWVAAGCGGAAAVPEAAALPEPAITYGAFNSHYRAASRGRVEQDYPGAGTTTGGFVLRYDLSVAVTATAAGHLAARIVVDSVRELSGGALLLPPAAARRVRGLTFTGLLAPTGVLESVTPSDTTSELGQQLGSRLKDFFPRLPPGGVRAAMVWTDTTSASTQSAGIDLTLQSINRHEAVGWGDHAGQRSLHIATRADYTVSGTGQQNGRHVIIAGTGVRHLDEYLAMSGAYLGMTAADTARMTATVEAVSLSIPITQTRFDTLAVAR